MEAFSGPSFLYHLLANELSVVCFGELDQAVENMAPLPDPKLRKKLLQSVVVSPVPPPQSVDYEAAFSKLEGMGFQVGLRLIERLTKDHPRFKDELDVMKFICTDLWKYVYEKQIDTLRTNNQGTYVLTDNNFRPLTFFGAEASNCPRPTRTTGYAGSTSCSTPCARYSDYYDVLNLESRVLERTHSFIGNELADIFAETYSLAHKPSKRWLPY